MAPRDEAMLVHMLRTALAHDDGPIALRYPRGTAEGVPLPERGREIPIGTGEVLAGGRAGRAARLRLRGPGRQRGGRGSSPSSDLEPDRRRRAASRSRSTASWSSGSPREHELLVTIEENVLAGGFGSAVLEHARGRLRRPRGARAR